MKNKKIVPIIFDTYLAVIRNSVGSGIFRNFYVKTGGRKADVMKNGNLSCAWFVSSVLFLFKLINEVHVTVDSTITDLEQLGWRRIGKPKAGSILVWGSNFDKDGWHRHIGFYIGNGKAVSNSTKLGKIARHHWTFGVKNGKPKRKVEAIFHHPKIANI